MESGGRHNAVSGIAGGRDQEMCGIPNCNTDKFLLTNDGKTRSGGCGQRLGVTIACS